VHDISRRAASRSNLLAAHIVTIPLRVPTFAGMFRILFLTAPKLVLEIEPSR